MRARRKFSFKVVRQIVIQLFRSINIIFVLNFFLKFVILTFNFAYVASLLFVFILIIFLIQKVRGWIFSIVKTLIGISILLFCLIFSRVLLKEVFLIFLFLRQLLIFYLPILSRSELLFLVVSTFLVALISGKGNSSRSELLSGRVEASNMELDRF